MENKVLKIVKLLTDNKGEDIKVYDVEGITPLASYYILVTGSNDRFLVALSSMIQELCHKEEIAIHHIEGSAGNPWILVDLYDIIIHILSVEERKRLNLESLLQGAKEIEIEESTK